MSVMAPDDVVADVREARMLHILATEPARVLPPGKSLLALMTRPPPSPPSPSLEPSSSRITAQVSEMLHKAFWDEATATITSPEPAVQLPRLRLLCEDLHAALAPLFPPSHLALLSLSAPLPPTSSPLHSTVGLLRDVLLALRMRCAPVRDPDIDALLAPLNVLPPFQAYSAPLASLVVDTFRSLISLADVLKNDLTQALFGSMSETQLANFINEQARTRERELVFDLGQKIWKVDPLPTIKEEALRLRTRQLATQWHAWLASGESPSGDWISRLMQALTSSIPVSCHPSDKSPNALPPQLFLICPSLLYIQNYLQALVICSSLKALLRTSPDSDITDDFIPRVWCLLKAEMDKDSHAPFVPGHHDFTDGTRTKLVNLADELIRARRMLRDLPTVAEEHDLRAAVERVLRLTDPVFMLLHRRLRQALVDRIHCMRDGTNIPNVPVKLRAGQGLARFTADEPTNDIPSHQGWQAIRGFENTLLMEQVDELLRKLWISVEWVETLWNDIM